MKACHKCGEAWTRRESPGFKETCPGCDGYLHACLNCRLYNPSADCCSSITAECTGARDGLNYCEEFQFREKPNNTNHRNGNGNGNGTRKNGSLDFSAKPRKNDTPAGPGRARKKFDDLFGK